MALAFSKVAPNGIAAVQTGQPGHDLCTPNQPISMLLAVTLPSILLGEAGMDWPVFSSVMFLLSRQLLVASH